MEGDFPIHDGPLGVVTEPMGPRVGKDDLAARGDPVVLRRDDAGLRAGADFQELVMDDGALAVGPEIDAVDGPVGEPEGLLMHVVAWVIRIGVLDRPVPHDRLARRSDHRVEERPLRAP